MIARRQLLGMTAGLAFAGTAAAQAPWPNRPVKLIVTFPPGGASDAAARVVAGPLSEKLGQTVIVDNKSGAAGAIGAVEVKNAKPDGYTLLVATSSTHAINPTAFVNPPYDAVKLHADLLGLRQPAGALRQPLDAAHDDGADRADEEESQQVLLRLGRLRQHHPPRRRIPEGLGRRHGRGARALQGRRAGHPGHHRGQHRLVDGDLLDDAAAAPGGQAQDHGVFAIPGAPRSQRRSRP